MGLEHDEVTRRVERRVVDRADDQALVLRLDLSTPLARRDAEALLVESHHAAQHPIEGVVAPYAVRADPHQVEVTLEAVHPELARLDHLLDGARRKRETLSASLAAALASTVAHLAHQIHLAAPLAGTPRIHRGIRPSSVLLSPAGSVALLGAGFPVLDALLVPTPERESDRLRYLAPEAARGEPIDSRSDVYALGALYYDLAAREPYRSRSATSDLGQKALEGRDPDLPGTLMDPRPSLIRLLSRALAPHPGKRFARALDFAEAVEAELTQSGLAFAGPHDLTAALETYLGEEVPRGPQTLVAPARASRSASPLRISMTTPPRHEAPTEDLLLDTASHASAWQDLLGEDARPHQKPSSADSNAHPHWEPSDPALQNATFAETPPAQSARLTMPLAPRNALDALKTPTGKTESARPYIRPPRKTGTTPRVGLLIGGLLVVLLGLGLYLQLQRAPSNVQPAPQPRETETARDPKPDPNPQNPPKGRNGRTPSPNSAEQASPRPIQLLSVISQPSGATVELDGGYIGQTPLVLKHEFAKSQYTLTILQEGYQRWEKVVSPDPRLHTINVLAVLQKE